MNFPTLFIGVILLIIAISVISFSLVSSGESKFAVGGFIGPFPFGFGNSPGMVWLAIGLSIIIVVVFLIVDKVVSG